MSTSGPSGPLVCHLLIFFIIKFFERFIQEYHQSIKQIESISGLTLSGLIWVLSVCKGYQQTTLSSQIVGS